MIERVRYQWRELKTCAARGERVLDRCRLAGDTVRFHLSNRVGLAAPAPARAYSVRVGDVACRLQLRIARGDFFVFHEVFTGEFYRIPAALRARIRTVLDLGSHVGLTALWWLESCPAARVVCVEPAADNAALLRRNLEAFATRVQVIEAAAGGTSGDASFAAEGPSWGRHLLADGTAGVHVHRASMDELMARAGLDTVDLLKVDIEGAEAELFDTPKPWMARVGILIIELHNTISMTTLTDTLCAAGFRLLPIGGTDDPKMITAVNESLHAPSRAEAVVASAGRR